jgi:hypothetical protein
MTSGALLSFAYRKHLLNSINIFPESSSADKKYVDPEYVEEAWPSKTQSKPETESENLETSSDTSKQPAATQNDSKQLEASEEKVEEPADQREMEARIRYQRQLAEEEYWKKVRNGIKTDKLKLPEGVFEIKESTVPKVKVVLVVGPDEKDEAAEEETMT